MRPLPNPSFDDPYRREDIILWLAYKEAKTMIKFEETPPPEAKGNQGESCQRSGNRTQLELFSRASGVGKPVFGGGWTTINPAWS